jgi:hypothetical protein
VVFDSAIDRTLSPRKIFHLEMTSSVGLRSREVIETHAFAQDTNTTTNTTTTNTTTTKKESKNQENTSEALGKVSL